MWCDIASSNTWIQAREIVYNTFGFKSNPDAYTNAVKSIKDSAKMIDAHLKGKQWLVGSSLTVADVVVFGSLHLPFSFVLDAGFRKAMPNVSAWFAKMSALPQVVKVCGHIKMCEKALKPPTPEKK